MNEWEPSRSERLMVAGAGLEWARGLIRRSREHLQRSESQRVRPIDQELDTIHERLSGLERLLRIIREEER